MALYKKADENKKMQVIMKLLGVGCDIVRVSRVERLCALYGYAKVYRKLCNSVIASDCTINKISPQSLAGRWALREAACKALNVPLLSVRLCELKNIKPEIVIDRVDMQNVLIESSISHDGDYAMAVVVAYSI